MLHLLHQVVDQSAERRPDKAAFSHAGQSISYEQLSLRANGLAATLIEAGVERGDRVGLLLPKALETAVSVYGCLKAGGIVVPLDSLSPAERLAAIVRDAGIRHLVVLPEQSGLVTKLLHEQGLQLDLVVGLDPDPECSAACIAWDALPTVATAPTINLLESDPAYLLYTSGSTGKPKGILHSHASGLAYAKLSADLYGVSSEDRLGNFAPLHFDQSTFDFYTGPLCGATTELIPPAFGFATASLARLLEKARISIWYSVPSVLIQLVLRDALVGIDLTSLRWILFGGEPFPAKHLRKLMSFVPHATFSNVYGPTEVNQCTYYNFPGDRDFDEPLPIGKAWANTEAFVVDSDDRPVPAGETGELLIRSPTMMIGYWNQPDLSRQAMLTRKRANGIEDTFYRTGDLVRCMTDGNLEFLGRKDRQIKTRGYRVELDEIESVLCLNDSVLEAAAYTVNDDDLGVIVEAAVIVADDSAVSDKDIGKHVARLLPAYARPRRISLLREFPRTRTGKIDRSALADRLS
jgi:amino acid adenylation domain-containing protein